MVRAKRVPKPIMILIFISLHNSSGNNTQLDDPQSMLSLIKAIPRCSRQNNCKSGPHERKVIKELAVQLQAIVNDCGGIAPTPSVQWGHLPPCPPHFCRLCYGVCAHGSCCSVVQGSPCSVLDEVLWVRIPALYLAACEIRVLTSSLNDGYCDTFTGSLHGPFPAEFLARTYTGHNDSNHFNSLCSNKLLSKRITLVWKCKERL